MKIWDQIIAQARLADPSLEKEKPRVYKEGIPPSLDPYDDAPIFVLGPYPRTKEFFLIHTVRYPVMATGEMHLRLPNVGTLRRLEFSSSIPVRRAKVMINIGTSIPFDVETSFLPRRGKNFVVIEHGNLNLQSSMMIVELILDVPSDAKLTGHSTVSMTYWQSLTFG